MTWTTEHTVGLVSLLFGGGGIGYAVITRALDKRKYNQEVRFSEADADLKTDEFWKGRYDILENELKVKDAWWKERYDNLYKELQDERRLSNDIIKSFRAELNEIRQNYQKEHEADKEKYDKLIQEYREFELQAAKKNKDQIERIDQLERIISEYETKLLKISKNE